MKASELRIGNLIFTHKEEIIVVKGIDTEGLILFKEDQNIFDFKCKPIPLTEEWLLKFGFEKNENGLFKLFNESEVPILLNEDLNGWTCDGINFSVNGTQYIHQLQNLYFALTGEELTIKKKVR